MPGEGCQVCVTRTDWNQPSRSPKTFTCTATAICTKLLPLMPTTSPKSGVRRRQQANCRSGRFRFSGDQRRRHQSSSPELETYNAMILVAKHELDRAGLGELFRRLLGRENKPYGSGGASNGPRALSRATPNSSSASSSHGRPTICTPTGIPCSSNVKGTVSAGSPSRLNAVTGIIA